MFDILNLSSKNDFCTTTFVCSPMGKGKSVRLASYAHKCIDDKESLFAFDFIEDSSFTRNIKLSHPNCIVIDLSDSQNLAFSFPEIHSSSEAPEVRSLFLEECSRSILSMLDIIALEPLTSKMKWTLNCIVKAVLSQPNKTLKDIGLAVSDPDIRNDYIAKYLQSKLADKDANEILSLHKLANNPPLEILQSIADRFEFFTQPAYLTEIYNLPYYNTIDFTGILQRHTPVVFLLSDKAFPNTSVKDFICYFLINRILTSIRLLHDRTKTHIIIDDITRVPNSFNYLMNTLPECRSLNLNYAFSSNSFANTVSSHNQHMLMLSGCNFMFIEDCSQKDFTALKDVFDLHLNYDSISHLEAPFDTLNVVYTKHGYEAFLSSRPVL